MAEEITPDNPVALTDAENAAAAAAELGAPVGSLTIPPAADTVFETPPAAPVEPAAPLVVTESVLPPTEPVLPPAAPAPRFQTMVEDVPMAAPVHKSIEQRALDEMKVGAERLEYWAKREAAKAEKLLEEAAAFIAG